MCKETPDTCSREEFWSKRGASDVPPAVRRWFERKHMWPSDPERPLRHLRGDELLAPVEAEIGKKWVKWVEEGPRPFKKKEVQMWSRRDGGRSVPRGRAWDLIERFSTALVIEQEFYVDDFDGYETAGAPAIGDKEDALCLLLDSYFIQNEAPDLAREATEATLAWVATRISLKHLYDLMHYAKFLSGEEKGQDGLTHQIDLLSEAIKTNNTSRLITIRNGLRDEIVRLREN